MNEYAVVTWNQGSSFPIVLLRNVHNAIKIPLDESSCHYIDFLPLLKIVVSKLKAFWFKTVTWQGVHNTGGAFVIITKVFGNIDLVQR